MNKPKPILVTGSHRSGTTWVGRMIASSPSVAYIHEPFNIDYQKKIRKHHFDHWFTYVCEQNEYQHLKYIHNTVNFRYDFIKSINYNRHPKLLFIQIAQLARLTWYRMTGVRPLLKDPIALFSAEWLSTRFNMNTVIMIRHPAAFAGSLKQKNKGHPFSHFLNQPLLMEEHLKPFEKEIIEFGKEEKDIIDQAALLWNLVHHVIQKYKQVHPDWIYIRHEDLSQNPLDGFRSLFQKLNLDFTEHVSTTIESYSCIKNSPALRSPTKYEKLQRDSSTNIYTWKERLTHSEISRIRSQVREISRDFYSEDEW